MKQIVEKHRFTYSLPGVIVGVWIPGQGEWVYASGIADTATGRLTASENKMRIASITKTYTATVVLQLIQEGKLTLDTTLDNFAPYVPRANRITVRHLLNHTSGIDTYSGGTFTTTLLNNPKTVWTPRQLIDLGISLPPTNEPGAMHSYSNTNYVLLGVIIEQLTGNSVEDEVQRRILTRLNLSSSSFPKTGVTALAAPFSHGYWPQGGGVLLDITELDPSSHWTSGGIVANVADLRAWGEALAKGTLLSAQMQNDRLTWVQNPHDAHKFYGLGIMRYGEFLGHDGTMPGYESLVYHLPSRNATIVVLTNGMRGAILSSPTEEIFKEIVNLLMPEAKAW
jgi:D-alanyl-D-alanine carboxypeptidase